MTVRHGYFLCMITLLAVLMYRTPAAAESTLGLAPAMRDADARLTTRVTLKTMHISLGGVLASLAKQSGAELTISTDLPSSGGDVTVWVENTPLYDVMDALWSLLSYKQAPWVWRRDGVPGHFSYALVETAAARAFAQRLRSLEQQAFEDEAVALVRFAHMTPEQRKEHIKELSASISQDDDLWAERILNGSSVYDRFWAGMRLFDESLSPELKNRVIHDHQTVRIPLDRISKEGQEFIAESAKGNTHQVNGVNQPIVPTYVDFVVEPKSGASQNRPHILYILPENCGGSSYVGAGLLEAGMCKRLRAAWMLPGDRESSPIEQKVIPPPQKEEPEGAGPPTSLEDLEARTRAGTLPSKADLAALPQRRVRQAADALPVTFIARLPQRNMRETGKPYGQTLGAFLGKYERLVPELFHKWRGNILLLTYPNWPYDEDGYVPYAVTLQIRKEYKKTDGFLRIRVLSDLIARMTTHQVEHASEEFPVLGTAEYFRQVFDVVHEYPAILGQEGLSLDPRVTSILASVPIVANSPIFRERRATAIRFLDYPPSKGGPARWEARVELLVEGKVWVPVAGLPQKKLVVVE